MRLALTLLVAGCTAPKPELGDSTPADTGCASPSTYYADADHDGFGDPTAPVTACAQPADAVLDATDCDDSAAGVHPGAAEIWYDGADEDCSGGSDYDQDGDGFDRDEECDDRDPTRAPTPDVEEIWYDGVDQNCDGNDGDQDGDGWYSAGYAFDVPAAYAPGDCWDDPADGVDWVPLSGLPPLSPDQVHPTGWDAPYDGLDADCAGDDDFDYDRDGFRSDAWPDHTGARGDDCADEDPGVHPGAADPLYDGVDADCAGDDDFDGDHDGYDATGGAGAEDCDDANPDIHPGATESCGTRGDDDCDGLVNEEGAIACTSWYTDEDGDGHGGGAPACLCAATGAYTETLGDDCADDDAAVHPGAPELCDSLNNGCTSGWTAAEEDGTVAEEGADGTWADLTASLAAGSASSPATWTLRDDATVHLCVGRWYVAFTIPDTVAGATVAGRYGADRTVLDAADTGSIVSGGGGVSLRGLTLTGGAAESGGAVSLVGGDLTVEDCVFDDNHATLAGGAIYVATGSASVASSVFTANTAVSAGGAIDAADAGLTVTGSTFYGNGAGTGDYAGGGALAYTSDVSTDLLVDGCSFDANTSTATTFIAFAGAFYVRQTGDGATTILDSTFENNTARATSTTSGYAFGGALYGAWEGDGPVSLDAVSFTSNHADSRTQSLGGGAYLWRSGAADLALTDATVTDNDAVAVSAFGGGLYMGAVGAAPFTVTGAEVRRNELLSIDDGANLYGGGVYLNLTGADATLSASTIEENASVNGAGLDIALATASTLRIEGGSELRYNDGDGLLVQGTDTASSVILDGSWIHENIANGATLYATGATNGAALTCIGGTTSTAGIWANGGWGVTGTCQASAACVLVADACDFNDYASVTGNGLGAVSLYGRAWAFGVDASFICDGVECM